MLENTALWSDEFFPMLYFTGQRINKELMCLYFILFNNSIYIPQTKVLAKGNQFSHGPMFWFSRWKQCHYLWADTVHAVRRPSQTRWDAFQSSCLFIVLYAGKHGICFDLGALVNANTMLVTLAFIDCDSSQL